eukprot:TRINITY_DN19641_c0_g1_i1.p1 TRINITY_DN19641_c0_g1~~TRINITY_DN19641_c0_g1_i1.p1  ORF type:complete len:142 (-),score=14.22 TRINITY_DN19641_c0_g1_i1:12-437(-)
MFSFPLIWLAPLLSAMDLDTRRAWAFWRLRRGLRAFQLASAFPAASATVLVASLPVGACTAAGAAGSSSRPHLGGVDSEENDWTRTDIILWAIVLLFVWVVCFGTIVYFAYVVTERKGPVLSRSLPCNRRKQEELRKAKRQ